MAALTWTGLLVSVAVMLPLGNGGFGPDVLNGWPNWLLVVAWQAIRAAGSQRPFTEEE
jgi:hypothetical protein